MYRVAQKYCPIFKLFFTAEIRRKCVTTPFQCVVQQQSGHIEHFIQKLQDVAVTLDNN